MELSYEETMRRIDKYEKEFADKGLERKFCRVNKYPWRICLYKGENKIIVVPQMTSIGGFSVEMAWFRQINDFNDVEKIGKIISEALKHISKSPVDARTLEERSADSILSNATNCKTYKEFEKSFLLCTVIYYEDGSYVIYPSGYNEKRIKYPAQENEISLPAESTDELIGQAIIKSFADMDYFHSKKRATRAKTIQQYFATLSDLKVSFEIPQDDKYTDEEDYGAAEMYQGYSYRKSEDDEESVSDMYFGIAAELDCNLSSDKILTVFENRYGKASEYSYIPIEHAVFQFRAEISGNNIHRILYLKQIDSEELLSCELTIDTKRAGKRLSNKLVKDFEKLVSSCRVE